MIIISEDLVMPNVETEVVTDSEIQPEGPEQGEATGIANLIHDLIIRENELIQQYNNATANMENYPELIHTMYEAAGTAFETIGKLQAALETISPNAANIEEGEVESEENLEITDDEILIENTTSGIEKHKPIDIPKKKQPYIPKYTQLKNGKKVAVIPNEWKDEWSY